MDPLYLSKPIVPLTGAAHMIIDSRSMNLIQVTECLKVFNEFF